MFKKLNSKGFGAVEGLLIIVIIAIIGGVGYFVYNANQQSNETLKGDMVNSTTTTKTKQINLKAYTLLAYGDFNYDLKFSIPSDWETASGGNFMEFTSPDYKTGQEDRVSSGAVLRIVVDGVGGYVDNSASVDANLLQEVEAGYGTPPISHKFITVDGRRAVQATVNYGHIDKSDEVIFYAEGSKKVHIALSYNLDAKNPYPNLVNTVVKSLKLTRVNAED